MTRAPGSLTSILIALLAATATAQGPVNGNRVTLIAGCIADTTGEVDLGRFRMASFVAERSIPTDSTGFFIGRVQLPRGPAKIHVFARAPVGRVGIAEMDITFEIGDDSVVILSPTFLHAIAPSRSSATRADSVVGYRAFAATRHTSCMRHLANVRARRGPGFRMLPATDSSLFALVRVMVHSELVSNGITAGTIVAPDSLSSLALVRARVNARPYIRGTPVDCPDYFVRVAFTETSDLTGLILTIERSCGNRGFAFVHYGVWELRQVDGAWRVTRKIDEGIT